MNIKVWEWPDRAEAKRLYKKNTEELGVGCFFFMTDPKKTDFIVAIPKWSTKQKLNELPEVLCRNTLQAIKEAARQKDAAILVNFIPPTYQIIKVPFDHNQRCELLFEAILQDKGTTPDSPPA